MARIEWFGKAHYRDGGGILVVRRGTLHEPVELASVSPYYPADSREPARVDVSITDGRLDLDELDALIAALIEQREHLAAEAADIAEGY